MQKLPKNWQYLAYSRRRPFQGGGRCYQPVVSSLAGHHREHPRGVNEADSLEPDGRASWDRATRSDRNQGFAADAHELDHRGKRHLRLRQRPGDRDIEGAIRDLLVASMIHDDIDDP